MPVQNLSFMNSNLPAKFIPKRVNAAFLVIVLTIFVYGGAIALLGFQLRNRIRQDIISQDSEVLYAANLMRQNGSEAEDGSPPPTDDPRDQLQSILETTRLRGVVFAVRLFDRNGEFLAAFPKKVLAARLAPEDVGSLRGLQTRSHFRREAKLSEIFPEGTATAIPLLEAIIPLRKPGEGSFYGAAQFLMDGEKVAGEFGALDQNLKSHFAVLMGVGGLLIGGGLGWAFRRLHRANALLAERTANLLRANHELTMAAKTSALGAVTAHLIHGLKNPLFGLQNFVSSRAAGPAEGGEGDWQAAVGTARKMQEMINDVVRILNEEDGVMEYEVTIEELGQIIAGKLAPLLQGTEIKLEIKTLAHAALANREANLVLLILQNLVQNSIQALKTKGRIELVFNRKPGGVECRLSDNGTGLPEHVLESLFAPCRSSKAGGSGIGLAISKQLAHHLGAELRLEKSSPEGAVFSLMLPEKMLVASPLPKAG